MRRRATPTLTWSVSCCAARPIQLPRGFCNRGLHSRALSTIADPPARVDARVGVFVDVENLGSFLKADGARRLVEWSTEYGKVVMRKAVGNFSNPGVNAHQKSLTENGFELLHVAPPVSGKSTADVRLAVEVMDMHTRLDAIVLATGDIDLSHVCFKLREHNKYVVGVMPTSPLSHIVKNSVDRLRLIDAHPLDSSVGRKRVGSARLAAAPLLRRAISVLDFGREVQASQIKEKMIALDPAFSERALGYAGFREYLEVSNLCEVYFLPDRPSTLFVKKTAAVDQGDTDLVLHSPVLPPASLLKQALSFRAVDFGGEVPASLIKETMMTLDPSFSEKALGYAGFKEFLEASNLCEPYVLPDRPSMLLVKKTAAVDDDEAVAVLVLPALPWEVEGDSEGTLHQACSSERQTGM